MKKLVLITFLFLAIQIDTAAPLPPLLLSTIKIISDDPNLLYLVEKKPELFYLKTGTNSLTYLNSEVKTTSDLNKFKFALTKEGLLDQNDSAVLISNYPASYQKITISYKLHDNNPTLLIMSRGCQTYADTTLIVDVANFFKENKVGPTTMLFITLTIDPITGDIDISGIGQKKNIQEFANKIYGHLPLEKNENSPTIEECTVIVGAR